MGLASAGRASLVRDRSSPLHTVLPDAVLRVGLCRHVAMAGVRVAPGGLVVRVVPAVQVVLVGISVRVREHAPSAVVPASPVVIETPPSEAAVPGLSASRNGRTEAVTAAESTDVAARMTFRHGSPCRFTSQREPEERSEQEDRQPTISIPCGRHDHTIGNRRAIAAGRRGPPKASSHRESCLGPVPGAERRCRRVCSLPTCRQVRGSSDRTRAGSMVRRSSTGDDGEEVAVLADRVARVGDAEVPNRGLLGAARPARTVDEPAWAPSSDTSET